MRLGTNHARLSRGCCIAPAASRSPPPSRSTGRMMLGEAAVRGQSTARSKRQHFHGISTVAAWLATKVYVPGGRNAN
jgi:hypothetical protein